MSNKQQSHQILLTAYKVEKEFRIMMNFPTIPLAEFANSKVGKKN